MRLINSASTIEAEPKRGHWEHDKDDEIISGYCSVCGWTSCICETDVADMPFCPNCGADMRPQEEVHYIPVPEWLKGEVEE